MVAICAFDLVDAGALEFHVGPFGGGFDGVMGGARDQYIHMTWFAVAGLEPQSNRPTVQGRFQQGLGCMAFGGVKTESVMWAHLWEEVKIATDMASS